MIKKLLLYIVLFAYPLLMFAPGMASASFSPFSGDCSGGTASKSALCTEDKNKSNPISGSNGIIYKITIIIAIVAGIAAIILIIISAIRFMTSGGDPQQVSSAKSSLLNTIIGLVVITLAASIISYIVGKV